MGYVPLICIQVEYVGMCFLEVVLMEVVSYMEPWGPTSPLVPYAPLALSQLRPSKTFGFMKPDRS